MSNTIFHNKYHQTNHHSVSTYGYPDSGLDPIANREEPFLGTFYNIVESVTPNLTGNSLEWYSSYTTLCANSGTYYLYITTRDTVTGLSAGWTSGSNFYNAYKPVSSGLDSTYTTVRENSANWPFLNNTLRLVFPQENTATKIFDGVTLAPNILSATFYGDFLNSQLNNSFNLLTGNFFTFYRNSSASFTDYDGYIKFLDNDGARYDYTYSSFTSSWEPQGLLIERTKTNSILYSESFDDAVWVPTNISIIPDVVLSPSNLLSADEIDIIGLAASLRQTVSVSPNTTYTFSVYIKLGTLPAEAVYFSIYNNSGSSYIAQNISPAVAPNKDTWTRIEYVFTTPGGCNSIDVGAYERTAGGPGGTIYLWGAQLEAGNFASSYIPTESAPYTRATEYGYLSGDFYNNAEGTFVFETKLTGTTASNSFTLIHLFGRDFLGQNQNFYLRFLGNRLGNARGTVNDSFAARFNINSNVSLYNYPRTLGLSYSRNNVVFADSGSIAGIDTSTLPINSLSSGYIGLSAPNALGDVYNGYIRRISYYRTQVSNSALKFLTLSAFQPPAPDKLEVYTWPLTSAQCAFIVLSATSFLQNIAPVASKFKGGDYTLVVRQDQLAQNQLIFDQDFVTVAGLSSTNIISLSSFSVTVVKFTSNGVKLYGKPTKYYYGLPEEYTYFSGPGILLEPNPLGLNAGEQIQETYGGLTLGVSAPYSQGAGITII